MKENKEETQLRSAEDQQHDAKLISAIEMIKRIHGADHSKEGHIGYYVAPLRIAELMVAWGEEYASQFKPSGVKTFTVEDMRAAFEAGTDAYEWSDISEWATNYTFDEWIKTRK